MPTLLQINECANHGSHGRIAEKLGLKVMEHGWNSYIAYGRYFNSSKSQLIKVGCSWNVKCDALQSRLLDNHGLASKAATKKLVEKIVIIRPDLVHLHNIHGYYLNYPLLFRCLREIGVPVVWTLHDCWTLTGHCAHFELANCYKWKDGCNHCANLKAYPSSLFLDRSARNYCLKKLYFNSLGNLTIVPVSYWLENIVKDSYLKNNKICTIQNGIDLDVFKPSARIGNTKDKFTILGVASVWYDTKGIEEFIKLADDENYQIVMVGTDEKVEKRIPSNVKCIRRTSNIKELAALYSSADILLNPTYNDTFPTVNLEAMACGTPVVTYNTGGSPETLIGEGGTVVDKGNFQALKSAIEQYRNMPVQVMEKIREKCISITRLHFNEEECYNKYWRLYESVINCSSL